MREFQSSLILVYDIGMMVIAWFYDYYCTVVVNLISRMTWFLTSQSSHHHSDFSHIIKANTYGKTEEKILKWPSISHPFPMQLHESMDALIASASTKKKVICLRICVQITIQSRKLFCLFSLLSSFLTWKIIHFFV